MAFLKININYFIDLFKYISLLDNLIELYLNFDKLGFKINTKYQFRISKTFIK